MTDALVEVNYPASFRQPPAMTALPSSLPAEPLPMDWVVYLLGKLETRKPALDTWSAYYEGDHPLSFFTRAFRSAFGQRWHSFASNFVMLVVDGLAERMEVQGFRFKDDAGDQDLWDVWQENDLDGVSQQAHTAALIHGVSYALVEPRPGKPPRITVEDARNAIVHCDPRDRRERLAGLKRYVDDDGHLVVILYLPDSWWYWRTEKPLPQGWNAWWEAKDIIKVLAPWQTEDRDWVVPSPIPVVPLIPLLNRPGLDGRGQSEVRPLTSNQDAINYYRAGAIIAARQMATPQRYLLNFDVEIDRSTGRPKEPFVTDSGEPANVYAVGNPDPAEGGPKPLWAPQAGQFEAADVTQFLRLIEGEVWQVASISRLPYTELLQSNSSIPSSGESLKASEAALIRKVGRAEIHLGEGWEEVMRCSLLARQDPRSTLRSGETLWVSAETRNEAVRTDSVVKLKAAGIIDEQTSMEMVGLTPQQIERQKLRTPPPPITRDQADIAGILVRGGWEPAAALSAVGAPPIAHTGLVPVTVTEDPEAAAKAKADAAAKAAAAAPQPGAIIPAPFGPRMSPGGPPSNGV